MAVKIEEIIEKIGEAQELAAYFKKLAEALEGGRVCLEETDHAAEGPLKFKASLNFEAGKFVLKCKLKSGGEAAAQELSYKKIKKAMSAQFKEILAAVKAETMPPMETVETFYDNGRAMVGFPGKGDEYYEAYDQAATRMMEDARSGDFAAFAASVEKLAAVKTDCHARHK